MLGFPLPESCDGKWGVDSARVRPICPGNPCGVVGVNVISASERGETSVLSAVFNPNNQVRSLTENRMKTLSASMFCRNSAKSGIERVGAHRINRTCIGGDDVHG